MVTTLYQCDKCGAKFPQKQQALDCENQPDIAFKENFKVGDIVTMHHGFGWFDGDPLWVRNPDTLKNRVKPCPNGNGNCFDSCCTVGFYYVITAITTCGHETIYHLATGAISDYQGYKDGYTCRNHHKITKVKDPPQKLWEDSRRFIGNTVNHSI